MIGRKPQCPAIAVRVAITAVIVITAVMAAAAVLLLARGAAQADGVTPTNMWMDIYSSNSTFAGVPIPVGSYVAVFDPQMTQCGEKVVTIAGQMLMPCYGDDLFTSTDEGAMQGDPLSFTLNGIAVVPQAVSRNFIPVPSDTVVTWTYQILWQINLVVPPRPPVTITVQSGQLRLDWQPVGAVTSYEIWRDTTPYFAPGDNGALLAGTVTPGAGPLSWSDGTGVGNPGVNYTYRVRSLNALSQTVGISQAVAEFDFALSH